ncbi:hypothetical protein K0M31_001901 [Melipona bicolor]|uniref:Uncharacterized protein n=1 Tax=Melipona bicolor TaxID=60889 RepID=A0AA40KY52_9HYME|nr:hypothetical protein K0M31_001901 [Melipona bicolor]
MVSSHSLQVGAGSLASDFRVSSFDPSYCGDSFAILRMPAIGLVVMAPTIVRIAALCMGSSSLRTEFDAELYTTAP